MAHPLDWITAGLHSLENHGLRRRLSTRHSSYRGQTIRMDGQDLIAFASNDYLGLAAEDLVPAVHRAIDTVGWGSGASPLICGHGAIHAELERQLALFEGTDAALLFSSGFAANLGSITALVGRGDAIYSDAKNHASIIDGCRLSGATTFVFPHRDVTSLQGLLEDSSAFRRRLIVTDSLFSMDGNLAPLDKLAELAEQFQAILMVDEAHATGLYGKDGRGVAQHLGAEDGIHLRIGTFSKALGSIGGFVASSQCVVDWLVNRARSYVFSTALPEAAAAAGLESLRLVREEPHRRTRLLERSAHVRSQLRQQNWDLGSASSQIVPLYVGTPQAAVELSTKLRQEGFLLPAIRPPSVPAGESLLRISLTYGHTTDSVDALVSALESHRPRP
ncbi:MAG: 8-amino-7-oxononanoate synthase [Planctomycetaceae bacterium]|nr:8-amino-7-oxononanoate synthase [Planctomycetaceae bacterium]